MSDNAVERLDEVIGGVIDSLLDADDVGGSRLIRGVERERLLDLQGQLAALRKGVTLPTPPRATPLDAACIGRWGCWEQRSERERGRLRAIMAEDITAAVGALSDEAAQAIWWAYQKTDTQPEGAEALRAALLARLTEGGA